MKRFTLISVIMVFVVIGANAYPWISPYAYCFNNPVKYVDPNGREPNKAYVGTVENFKNMLDNSPNRVGLYRGSQAAAYMIRLCNTEWSSMKKVPTETGYFNKKVGRYIYTKKGGWIDMTHFMFYAGQAYKYKTEGCKDPIGETIQDGYRQETADLFFAPHSSFSYEDLPTDKIAAIFGADFFDPNNEKTLSEQIVSFLNQLGATSPQNAPNFNLLPSTDEKTNKPSKINKTTKPIYMTND